MIACFSLHYKYASSFEWNVINFLSTFGLVSHQILVSFSNNFFSGINNCDARGLKP